MRVLHVIPAVAPRYGGPSRAIVEMCHALQDEGLGASRSPLRTLTGPGACRSSMGNRSLFIRSPRCSSLDNGVRPSSSPILWHAGWTTTFHSSTWFISMPFSLMPAWPQPVPAGATGCPTSFALWARWIRGACARSGFANSSFGNWRRSACWEKLQPFTTLPTRSGVWLSTRSA